MRVALCVIALSTNESHPDLSGLLASARAVGCTDLILGVDDRSHPNTADWARENWPGADCFTYRMEADGDPHFANARNLTLARIPKECEWWVWADSDDTIESTGGKTFIEMIEKLRPGVGALVFNYHYADDAFGNPKGHLKGRLYRTSVGWEWRGRVHEDVHPLGDRILGKDILAVSDGDEKEFVWRHHREMGIPKKGRNFRCLRRMLMDDPDDPKAWFFIGNQHFAAGNWRLAAEAYERYVPMSGWGEQKYWALVYSAIAYRALGDSKKAVEPDTTALHLFPNLVDAYFGLGESYCRLGDWESALRWGELGFERLRSEDTGSPQKAIPSAMVWFNATSYNYSPYLWMATAYMNRNQNERALSCYQQAYKARPEEELEGIIRNLEWAMNRERITVNGLDLAAGLVKLSEPIKAMNVLANLPAGSKDDERVVRFGTSVSDRFSHLRDQTAYQNFYFRQEERGNDPLVADAQVDMLWALRRLQNDGAKKVLDVGVGDGTFAFLLARHGIQVVGTDVDWSRVQAANRAAVTAGYQSSGEFAIERPLVFSDDCACEHGRDDHSFTGCGEVDCVCGATWDEAAELQTMTLPEATPESLAQFLYCPPDQWTAQVRALGPYDAVVGLNLLEHVQNPEQTLGLMEEMAPLVLLSTPDGEFSGPTTPTPGRVRAYSRRDLTRLLVPRGWPSEMHLCRRSLEEQAHIVAEYSRVAPEVTARVVIFCPPTAMEWSPESLRTGLGGSETAVVHMARELVTLGKRVTVYGMCEGIWDGVRYRDARDFRPEACEVFIAWRNPLSLLGMVDLAPHRWLWLHDVHAGDFFTESVADATTAILALSEWHKTFLLAKYPFLHRKVTTLDAAMLLRISPVVSNTITQQGVCASTADSDRPSSSGNSATRADKSTQSLGVISPLGIHHLDEAVPSVQGGQELLESGFMFDTAGADQTVVAADGITSVDTQSALLLGRGGTVASIDNGVGDTHLRQSDRKGFDDLNIASGHEEGHVGRTTTQVGIARKDASLSVEVPTDVTPSDDDSLMLPHKTPIHVLDNGIMPERFDAPVVKIPHRLIYAQSPDRGLDRLLDLFPKIRKRYPDATLSVFYGFDAARKWYPEWMAELEERLASTEGVTVHGWVGQDRLAEEYLKADVLLYPAMTPTGERFPETYCISAVEAQAAGCFPITADHGALAETNAKGWTTSDFDSEALDLLDKFWSMSDHTRERHRAVCRAWARRQTWHSVAKRWMALCGPVLVAAE